MSSRRRTNPPPGSMAGPFTASLGLVVVGLVVVGLVISVGDLFGSLRRLGVFDRSVLDLGVLDGLLSRRGILDRSVLDNRLVGSGLGGLGGLGGRTTRLDVAARAAPAGAVGLRGHRLLPHQLDDRHRSVVALAVLDLDDAGV